MNQTVMLLTIMQSPIKLDRFTRATRRNGFHPVLRTLMNHHKCDNHECIECMTTMRMPNGCYRTPCSETMLLVLPMGTEMDTGGGLSLV